MNKTNELKERIESMGTYEWMEILLMENLEENQEYIEFILDKIEPLESFDVQDILNVYHEQYESIENLNELERTLRRIAENELYIYYGDSCDLAKEEAELYMNIPGHLESYFDYEKFGEDLMQEERYCEIDNGSRILVLDWL